MKAKKLDIEFMNEFILNCSQNHQNTISQICQEAQNRIDQLDCQLRKIENIKSERASYRDIIHFFNQMSQCGGEKLLPFFNLSNKYNAFQLCQNLPIKMLNDEPHSLIKEMQELKIVQIDGHEVRADKNLNTFYHFFEMFYAA